jgi:hypothetical protein
MTEQLRFSHIAVLEVLYVKSKKKTQVPNCPGAEVSSILHLDWFLHNIPSFFSAID